MMHIFLGKFYQMLFNLIFDFCVSLISYKMSLISFTTLKKALNIKLGLINLRIFIRVLVSSIQ